MAPKKQQLIRNNYDPKEVVVKSSCSVWFIIFSLLGILVVFLLLVFLAKPKITQLKNLKFNHSENLSLVDRINKEKDRQTGESTVSVSVTESELGNLIKINDPTFPLKKAKLKVTPDKIIISGKTGTSIFSLGVDVGVVPKVENGKPIFNIVEIKSAGVSAPKPIADTINKEFRTYIAGYSDIFQELNLTEIKLNSGFLIVTGQQ